MHDTVATTIVSRRSFRDRVASWRSASIRSFVAERFSEYVSDASL